MVAPTGQTSGTGVDVGTGIGVGAGLAVAVGNGVAVGIGVKLGGEVGVPLRPTAVASFSTTNGWPGSGVMTGIVVGVAFGVSAGTEVRLDIATIVAATLATRVASTSENGARGCTSMVGGIKELLQDIVVITTIIDTIKVNGLLTRARTVESPRPICATPNLLVL